MDVKVKIQRMLPSCMKNPKKRGWQIELNKPSCKRCLKKAVSRKEKEDAENAG
jgi:hypothetical protein